MAARELIRNEANGTLGFGNYELKEKTKKEDFEHKGDLYKVKTYEAITKLERNGMFVYESVPGTTVSEFDQSENGVSFSVEGNGDAQITVGLADGTEYSVIINGENTGKMGTGLSGKLNFSVELNGTDAVKVEITK